MSGKPGWTNQELLDEARRRGYKATERMIVDWTQLGLLDQPTRRGTGRGSEPAVRSDNQAKLFFTLLDKRRSARVVTLCNLPVYVWLGWGDQFVPIRQVRRAMRTFSDSAIKTTVNQARAVAESYIDTLHLTHVPPRTRQAITRAFSTLGSSQRVSELDPQRRSELSAALRDALTDHSTALHLPSIDIALDALDGRLRTAAIFRDRTDDTTFPDRVFQNAQFLHRLASSMYIAQDPREPLAFQQELANGACNTLLQLLAQHLPAEPTP